MGRYHLKSARLKLTSVSVCFVFEVRDGHSTAVITKQTKMFDQAIEVRRTL